MRRTLFILTFLALNAFASDCIQTIFDLYIGKEYGIYDKSYEGYVPDSIYYEEKGADIGLLDQIRITKYYRTGRHLDSTMEYFIKPNTTIQELTIYNDTTIIENDGNMMHISIYKDGHLFKKRDVFLNEKENKFQFSEMTYSSDNGSVVSDKGSCGILRDTLYSKSSCVYAFSILVRDPEDEGRCIDPYQPDSTYPFMSKYEYEIRGDTLIQTWTSMVFPAIEKSFYVYVGAEEEPVRIAPKKIYPLADWRKFKQFDLLGRPARGKYTVKLSR